MRAGDLQRLCLRVIGHEDVAELKLVLRHRCLLEFDHALEDVLLGLDVISPLNEDLLLLCPLVVGHPLEVPLPADLDLLMPEAVNVFSDVDQVIPMNIVVEFFEEDYSSNIGCVEIRVMHPRGVLARKQLTIVQVNHGELVNVAKSIVDDDAQPPAEPATIRPLTELVSKQGEDDASHALPKHVLRSPVHLE